MYQVFRLKPEIVYVLPNCTQSLIRRSFTVSLLLAMLSLAVPALRSVLVGVFVGVSVRT